MRRWLHDTSQQWQPELGLPRPQYNAHLLVSWFTVEALHGVASARVIGGPLRSYWLIICSHRVLKYAQWRGDQRVRVVVRHSAQRVLRRERVGVIMITYYNKSGARSR